MKFRHAAIFLIALNTVGHAQVHKCPNGMYTDKACPDGSTGSEIKLPAAGMATKIQFVSHLETYPVHGRTWPEVYANMMRNGPYTAWARWNVKTSYSKKQSQETCSIEDLTITIDGTIRMPEWQQRSSAAPKDRKGWDDSYAVLRIHEEGHIDHGKALAILLREKIAGIGRQPCTQIDSIAKAAQSQLTERLQKSDEDYDRFTNHGLKQFNPD
ncbi:MAG: DUF922 domain-containing protein [Pseudomonadota bacterium]